MVVDSGIGYDAIFLQSIWHDTSVEHEELNTIKENPNTEIDPNYSFGDKVKSSSDIVLYRINSFLIGILALMSPFMAIRAWYDGVGAIDTNKHGGDRVSMNQVLVLTYIMGMDGRHTQQWVWMDIFELPQAIRFSWCKFTHKYLNLMPNLRGKSNALYVISCLFNYH